MAAAFRTATGGVNKMMGVKRTPDGGIAVVEMRPNSEPAPSASRPEPRNTTPENARTGPEPYAYARQSEGLSSKPKIGDRFHFEGKTYENGMPKE